MSRTKLALLTLLLSCAPLHAQGWIEFVDKTDRFIVNFPGEPEVRNVSYETELGVELPARVYSVDKPSGRFVMTVVDYTQAERVHRELCENNSGQDCNGLEAGTEVRGAIAFAAWNYRKSTDGKITYDAYAQVDGIPGHQLQITHPDGSRTFVAIHLHARRLYILEGTVPEDAPPPGMFQQSLGILDERAHRVRYTYDENDRPVRVDTAYEWIGADGSATD